MYIEVTVERTLVERRTYKVDTDDIRVSHYKALEMARRDSLWGQDEKKVDTYHKAIDTKLHEGTYEKPIRQHLLITSEMMQHMPKTLKIVMDWGDLDIFIGEQPGDEWKTGLHCFVDGSKDDFLAWYDKCNEFIIGSGSPQMEQFTIHRDKTNSDSVTTTRLEAAP